MVNTLDIRNKRDNYLATAQRIVSTAATEGRGLSEAERNDVTGLREKATAINETLRAADWLRDEQEALPAQQNSRMARPTPELRTEGQGIARMIRALAAGKGDPERAARHAEKVFGDEALSRVLSTNSGTGGFLVPEVYSQELIELLRPASVVRRFVTSSYPIPNGNATIPKLTGGSAAAYLGENENITTTEPTFGQVKATAKKLAAIVPISNDLVRFSSPAADNIVRNDLVAAIAQAENLAFIRGTGLSSTPKGLRNWAVSGNVVHCNATVNLANITTDLLKLQGLLMGADVRMLNPAWIMAPRTMIYLRGLRDTNGNKAFPEMENGNLLGYPFATTTQIPINLAVTQTAESEVYFVDFADVVIAEVPGMLISVSDTAAYHDGSNVVSAFSKDQTVIRVIAQHDLVVRHTASIAVLDDVDWA